MDFQEITFTPTTNINEMYFPKPSKFFLPEWYKKTESYIGGEKIININNPDESNATIKKCMPVFDALTAGYIIPLPCDIEVKLEDGKSIFYSDTPIAWHSVSQANNYPAPHKKFLPKFLNPWGIQTSIGTSCLFINPVHQDLPFKVLEGVVDTDSYSVPVNFPFVLNDKNWEGHIKAGTPMVQVMPFVRTQWSMSFGNIDNYKEYKSNEELLYTKSHDRYKTLFRKKKDYK